jgi:hypothetical protein
VLVTRFSVFLSDYPGRTNRVQAPLGFSTTLTYEPATGWLSSLTDPLGRTTGYQY